MHVPLRLVVRLKLVWRQRGNAGNFTPTTGKEVMEISFVKLFADVIAVVVAVATNLSAKGFDEVL